MASRAEAQPASPYNECAPQSEASGKDNFLSGPNSTTVSQVVRELNKRMLSECDTPQIRTQIQQL
eukprot:12211399-Heterocapsa_arctica.AAC.1